jgi:hypothetical protein
MRITHSTCRVALFPGDCEGGEIGVKSQLRKLNDAKEESRDECSNAQSRSDVPQSNSHLNLHYHQFSCSKSALFRGKKNQAT